MFRPLEWGRDSGPRALCIRWLIGFAIKHNLDRLVATFVFHRQWGPFNYWIPLGRAVRIVLDRKTDEPNECIEPAVHCPFPTPKV